MAPKEGVQSLSRAFGLLEHLTDAGGSASLSELATISGLPLGTIHRLMQSLVGLGYARQEATRRYSLGPRLIRLGESASHMLGSWVMPYLASLVDEIGETANAAMLEGDSVVYVAQAPSPHSMRMFTEVGRRVLPHCTGVGKALLSQLTDDEVLAMVTRTGMPPLTPQTIVDKSQLIEELAQIRELGYAVDNGEQELGVRCVAVPVVGVPVRTAISISGPDSRVTMDLVPEVAPVLVRACVALVADLTNQGNLSAVPPR
ncbi:MAG: regulatory protein IclR [Marmoricola sp.]|nr:regulatory protein IclR [Marmoricola sp.]